MLPVALPRFIRMPGERSATSRWRRDPPQDRYLFPKYDVLGGGAFRILRDSDIEVEEEAEDLVRYFRTAIKRRRRGRVVRLELDPDMPAGLRAVLSEGLDSANAITSESRGFLGMATCRCWSRRTGPTSSSRPSTRASRAHPRTWRRLLRGDPRQGHPRPPPYESFEVVVEFVRQAAADPDVVAIKQTLYRAGKHSAIVRA
jgi:polyphosphate kinase